MNSPCQFLEWDSAFFDKRIARVNAHILTPDAMQAVGRWCDAEYIECLYFLADSDDDLTVRLAEQHGFHLVDLRVTLRARLNSEPLPVDSIPIRPLLEADMPAMRDIARGGFTDSRFYVDGRFPRERCDALYETWLEKSAANPGSSVLVAEADGAAIGFLICDRNADGTGQFALMGVDEAYRGRGIGTALIGRGLAMLRAEGIHDLIMVTQGRNLASQRVYQKHGFRTAQVQLWYHRWFD